MSYREKPATPNSPSGTTVTTVYDHLLSPSSPAHEEEEKDDRLKNDLLDEICTDMGIDDSMDLDLDDFCYNAPVQAARAAGTAASSRSGSAGDERRCSVTTSSSSGYITSDSLCAIAKLTHSISHENTPMNESVVDVKSRIGGSPDSGGPGSVKQEPPDHEVEPVGNVNDTDQGKVAAAAAASKLALQKQEMSVEPACSGNDMPSTTSAAASGMQAAATANQRYEFRM